MLGQVSAGGWSLTGSPGVETVGNLRPPVLHGCPSLPHKERALQFSGQSHRARAERGGGGLLQSHASFSKVRTDSPI